MGLVGDRASVDRTDGWTVVVPPLPSREADMLWGEWLTHAAVEPRHDDVRVDVIRAAGGEQRRYSVWGVRLVDTDQLVSSLRQFGGEIGSIADEHVEQYGGVLLHLLTADLRRYARGAFEERSREGLIPLLDILADAFERADAPVQNAIAVSFVEDSCPWDRAASGFLAVWPDALREEARRQLQLRG